MNFDADIEEFLKDLEINLSKAMPNIRKKIKVYEDKLASGNLIQNPVPSPQFNG